MEGLTKHVTKHDTKPGLVGKLQPHFNRQRQQQRVMAAKPEAEAEPEPAPAPEPEPAPAPRTKLNDILAKNGIKVESTAKEVKPEAAVEFFSIETVTAKLSTPKQHLRMGTGGLEAISMVARPAWITTLSQAKKEVKGTLFLSNYRLGFLSDDCELHHVATSGFQCFP